MHLCNQICCAPRASQVSPVHEAWSTPRKKQKITFRNTWSRYEIAWNASLLSIRFRIFPSFFRLHVSEPKPSHETWSCDARPNIESFHFHVSIHFYPLSFLSHFSSFLFSSPAQFTACIEPSSGNKSSSRHTHTHARPSVWQIIEGLIHLSCVWRWLIWKTFSEKC